MIAFRDTPRLRLDGKISDSWRRGKRFSRRRYAINRATCSRAESPPLQLPNRKHVFACGVAERSEK